jgi:hypothetical protein
MTLQTLSPMQYLVAEDGKRIGVVLDWETYQIWQKVFPNDPDLLVGLTEAELKFLAEGMLSPSHQTWLNELLEKNATTNLTPQEEEELDKLLGQIDSMNLLKARAQYTLQQRRIH